MTDLTNLNGFAKAWTNDLTRDVIIDHFSEVQGNVTPDAVKGLKELADQLQIALWAIAELAKEKGKGDNFFKLRTEHGIKKASDIIKLPERGDPSQPDPVIELAHANPDKFYALVVAGQANLTQFMKDTGISSQEFVDRFSQIRPRYGNSPTPGGIFASGEIFQECCKARGIEVPKSAIVATQLAGRLMLMINDPSPWRLASTDSGKPPWSKSAATPGDDDESWLQPFMGNQSGGYNDLRRIASTTGLDAEQQQTAKQLSLNLLGHAMMSFSKADYSKALGYVTTFKEQLDSDTIASIHPAPRPAANTTPNVDPLDALVTPEAVAAADLTALNEALLRRKAEVNHSVLWTAAHFAQGKGVNEPDFNELLEAANIKTADQAALLNDNDREAIMQNIYDALRVDQERFGNRLNEILDHELGKSGKASPYPVPSVDEIHAALKRKDAPDQPHHAALRRWQLAARTMLLPKQGETVPPWAAQEVRSAPGDDQDARDAIATYEDLRRKAVGSTDAPTAAGLTDEEQAAAKALAADLLRRANADFNTAGFFRAADETEKTLDALGPVAPFVRTRVPPPPPPPNWQETLKQKWEEYKADDESSSAPRLNLGAITIAPDRSHVEIGIAGSTAKVRDYRDRMETDAIAGATPDYTAAARAMAYKVLNDPLYANGCVIDSRHTAFKEALKQQLAVLSELDVSGEEEMDATGSRPTGKTIFRRPHGWTPPNRPPPPVPPVGTLTA